MGGECTNTTIKTGIGVRMGGEEGGGRKREEEEERSLLGQMRPPPNLLEVHAVHHYQGYH